MGVPTPPRSSTGSLHAQVAAKPLLPQASTPLCWGFLAHADSSLPGSPSSPQISVPFRPTPAGTLCCRAGHQGPPLLPNNVPPLPYSGGGPHRYTSARMLSMVATSGWQWPELRLSLRSNVIYIKG